MAEPAITLLEGFHAVELAMEDGRVVGVFARTGVQDRAHASFFSVRAVIFATGGLGALYAVTTNPLESRGEGLGMAARAGAVISDPEFVPVPSDGHRHRARSGPLATEALRGEGAMLVDERACASCRPYTGCGACAARRGGASHPPRDRARPSGVSRLPRGHRRGIPASFPDRLCRLQKRRHRSGHATDPGRARHALSHGRHRQRCAGTLLARRPVGCRRMRFHRVARRQPPRLQLPARSPRIRNARCGGYQREQHQAPVAAHRLHQSVSQHRRRMCCAMR